MLHINDLKIVDDDCISVCTVCMYMYSELPIGIMREITRGVKI